MRGLAFVAVALGIGGAAAAQEFAPGVLARPMMEDGFAPLSPAGQESLAARLAQPIYQPGAGPVVWRSGEIPVAASPGGSVDTLRVSIGGALRAPGGLPLALERAEFAPEAYDVTLVRSWPGAVSFASGDFDIDLSPHAGVGVSNLGGQAEAGAMLSVSRSREEAAVQRLQELGVKDGLSFGDRGRWYLFAAASGRAVGLNMLRDERGWDRAGLSTDPTGALIGDAQVGVGWRKGDVQTSFGVIHREVRGEHMVFAQHTREDTVAAFTLSIRPQR